MNKSTKNVIDGISTFVRGIRRSKLLGTALFVLAITHLAMQLCVIAPTLFARTDQDRDVVVYWQAAQNAHNQEFIYGEYPNYGPDSLPQNYDYAPPFAAVLSSLGALSFVTFARLWLGLTIVAFWVFAWCLAKLSGEGSLRRTLICGLIAGLFPGTYLAIALGQVDPVLWALFALGLIGVARPVLWGLDAIVKPYYLWSLLAAPHSKRALIPAGVLAVALIVLGGSVCGWDSYLVWVRDILPTLTQGNFKTGNVSVSFAVLRLARFLGWNYLGGPLPTIAHLWLTVASIGAPFLTWWFMRRFSSQLKCASIIAASVLFAPVCWTCYLPLLLTLPAIGFKTILAQNNN